MPDAYELWEPARPTTLRTAEPDTRTLQPTHTVRSLCRIIELQSRIESNHEGRKITIPINPISNMKKILGSMLTRQDGISHPHPQNRHGSYMWAPADNVFVMRPAPVVNIHGCIILCMKKHEAKNLHHGQQTRNSLILEPTYI